MSADTQTPGTSNVVPLRSEADRIAAALRLAQHRRFQKLCEALHATKEAHVRNWMSFDWDAAELVEKK